MVSLQIHGFKLTHSLQSEKWKRFPVSVSVSLSLVHGCLSSPSSLAPVEGRFHPFLRPGLWSALSCLTWEPTWSAISISLWLQLSHSHLKLSYPGGTHPSSKHTQTHSHTHPTSLWPIFSPGKTIQVQSKPPRVESQLYALWAIWILDKYINSPNLYFLSHTQKSTFHRD